MEIERTKVAHFFSLMMLLAMMLGYVLRCELQDSKGPAIIVMLIVYFGAYDFVQRVGRTTE